MKKKRTIKIEDNGFTFVELLIAIAIIAVIVAPILTNIAASMKVNKKSDELLTETAVAQTVMEGMANQSLEDLAMKFSEYNSVSMDFLPLSIAGHREIVENNTTLKSVLPDAEGKLKFSKKASNQYFFAIDNIMYDNKTYDVKVTLDASEYYKKALETEERHNDKYYVDLADFNADYDAMYSENVTINKQLCQDIAVESVTMGTNRNADDIAKNAKRTMTIKISKTPDPALGKDITEVNVNYKIEVPQSYVGDGVKNVNDQDYGVYSNKKDPNLALRNIYILYNPNYHSTVSGADCKDNIIIENEDNIPVNVYLIKQNSAEAAKMSALETNYRVNVKTVDTLSSGNNPTHIRTNIGYNLENLLRDNEYKEIQNQCSLSFEHSTGVEFPEFYKVTETVTGKNNETVRVYTKKVEVYTDDAYVSTQEGGGFNEVPLSVIDSEPIPTVMPTVIPTVMP